MNIFNHYILSVKIDTPLFSYSTRGVECVNVVAVSGAVGDCVLEHVVDAVGSLNLSSLTSLQG